MQVEVGAIFQGKITGITKFGAFVEFDEGKTGMVHISEVAPTYVNEITDHVSEGQIVKVKVLSISDEGKIALSMKKAIETPVAPRRDRGERGNFKSQDNRNQRGDRRPRNNNYQREPVVSPGRPGDYEWQSKTQNGENFEDMLSKFKQSSDEKISDLKKPNENRRSGHSSRRDNQR